MKGASLRIRVAGGGRLAGTPSHMSPGKHGHGRPLVPQCSGCLCWLKNAVTLVSCPTAGICRRYPTRIQKDGEDWCDEFKDKGKL